MSYLGTEPFFSLCLGLQLFWKYVCYSLAHFVAVNDSFLSKFQNGRYLHFYQVSEWHDLFLQDHFNVI